ncbi:hypothetical protein SBADM41S_04925 [Streptomyces badius]
MRSDENSAYYGPADGQLFPTELRVIVATITAVVHDGLRPENCLLFSGRPSVIEATRIRFHIGPKCRYRILAPGTSSQFRLY